MQKTRPCIQEAGFSIAINVIFNALAEQYQLLPKDLEFLADKSVRRPGKCHIQAVGQVAYI